MLKFRRDDLNYLQIYWKDYSCTKPINFVEKQA